MTAPTLLPSGTVTLVFTDIEKSTRILQVLGEQYEAVLMEHQELVRGVLARHRGHEVGTAGDSFFLAFADARDAVAFAVNAQRAEGPLIHHDPIGRRLGLQAVG